MGTTGAQLDKWCRKNHVVGFKGVFCADNLPTAYRPKNMCCIINHSPCASSSGGSHWVACRVQGNRAEWFDSYGMPPHSQLENDMMGSRNDPHPHFDQWLQNIGVTHTNYNSRDIQSVASEVCGLYACWFAKHGQPVDNPKAWRFLSSNVQHNDHEIKELVKV